MIFKNSIRNVTKFFDQWRKSHMMTSWKDCKNEEYESLRNSDYDSLKTPTKLSI